MKQCDSGVCSHLCLKLGNFRGCEYLPVQSYASQAVGQVGRNSNQGWVAPALQPHDPAQFQKEDRCLKMVMIQAKINLFCRYMVSITDMARGLYCYLWPKSKHAVSIRYWISIQGAKAWAETNPVLISAQYSPEQGVFPPPFCQRLRDRVVATVTGLA